MVEPCAWVRQEGNSFIALSTLVGPLPQRNKTAPAGLGINEFATETMSSQPSGASSRIITNATLVRLDIEGQEVVSLPETAAEFTPATEPSPPETISLPHTLSGLECSTFELGDAPRLVMLVPVRSANQMLELMRGRLGFRTDDDKPLTKEAFDLLVQRGMAGSDSSMPLVLRYASSVNPGVDRAMRFDAVDLQVVGARVKNDLVTHLKVVALAHHNLQRDYVPRMGYSGVITNERRS